MLIILWMKYFVNLRILKILRHVLYNIVVFRVFYKENFVLESVVIAEIFSSVFFHCMHVLKM